MKVSICENKLANEIYIFPHNKPIETQNSWSGLSAVNILLLKFPSTLKVQNKDALIHQTLLTEVDNCDLTRVNQ